MKIYKILTPAEVQPNDEVYDPSSFGWKRVETITQPTSEVYVFHWNTPGEPKIVPVRDDVRIRREV